MTNRKPHQSDRHDNGSFNALVVTTEQATKAVAPFVKSATCANLELVSLAGRRARAYLDLPSVLAQCRGPQDLFAAQAHFWQTALKDYTECSQRIAATFSSLVGSGSAVEDSNGVRRERDTLTFPEVFSFAGWTLPDSEPGQRSSQGRAA